VRRRFFIQQQFTGNSARMEGEAAHHLGRVLRAQPGQLYELSDGQQVRLAQIENVSRDRIEFALLDEIAAHPPALDVTLLLAVVKFDAFEWAIEKATELGVTTIVPLAAARSEKSLLAAAAKRAERWNKILLESSQQSRRLRIPVLRPLTQVAPAFAEHSSASIRVMLSEQPEAPSLRTILHSMPASRSAVLAIGPEGGWTEAELACAQAANFHQASLGKLILRTETAVAAALASINFALSDSL
jgi:16S rRNA (uracil1498-N3)-methyltransferase